jgi:hypothetical protein
MWPMDRLPRVRPSAARCSRSLSAVFALVALVLATVGSPIVLAGSPPPSTVGPLLQVSPASGRAAASFTARYWYVDGTGGKCPFTTAEISWDAKLVVTAKMDPPDPKDLTYCSVTHVFSDAPTSVPGGHALSVLACFIDGNGKKQCPGSTLARKTYVILPTPTLRLKPGTGLASAAFTATYASGELTCSHPSALFFWDGSSLGKRVALDPKTCSADLDLPRAPAPDGTGSHRMTAESCDARTCDASTRAVATYTVTAPKPTATPAASPTPSAASSATSSSSPTPSTSPVPSPSASPFEARPSGLPEGSGATPVPASPAPSLGVRGTTDQGGPPPTGGPYVPAMAAYVGGPDRDGIDPEVVATNLLLTLLLVFLFALTAEIFNSTMDANRDVIHGWWLRLAGGPFGILGSLTVPGASLTRLAGSGRIGSIARVLAVLCLLGFVYSLLSPDFGLNSQTVVLFVSLVVGLGFLTYFQEGSTSRIAARRYRANASIKLYGTAVMVSIVAVVISRLVAFQPGLVYGFIASAVIVAPVALGRRDDATLVLVPAVGLIVVSLAAWLLLGPVTAAAAGGAPVPGLAQTILAMIVIGGFETLFVSMIPLRFMDGAAVMSWSRPAWALTFGTVTFLWWQLLLNQDHAYVEAMEQTNVQVVLATVVVFMLTTGGLWSYFRFRPAQSEAEAEA